MQNLCEKIKLDGTKWDKPKQANADFLMKLSFLNKFSLNVQLRC